MKYYLGIDLGGTSIKYGVVSQSGEVLEEGIRSTDAHLSRENLLDNLANIILEQKEICEQKQISLEGVGVGTPGIVEDGVVIGGAENLPQWEDLPLKNILEERTDLKVLVENDANTMGLGETCFGSAKNAHLVVFLTVGTGIGGTVVVENELLRGYRSRGMELGHIFVCPDGELCSCGKKGCLEAHASTTALIRDYLELNSDSSLEGKVNGKFIVEKYLEGDAIAVKALNQHIDFLARGVASYINIFSPEKVVIGGGISEAGEFYIEAVRKRALELAMPETSLFTEIITATLGNKAGFLGAAALHFVQS